MGQYQETVAFSSADSKMCHSLPVGYTTVPAVALTEATVSLPKLVSPNENLMAKMVQEENFDRQEH